MRSMQDTSLDPTRWGVDDPLGVVSVNGGKLQSAGGTGIDGQTTVAFAEKTELAGAWFLRMEKLTSLAHRVGFLVGLFPLSCFLPAGSAGFGSLPHRGLPRFT